MAPENFVLNEQVRYWNIRWARLAGTAPRLIAVPTGSSLLRVWLEACATLGYQSPIDHERFRRDECQPEIEVRGRRAHRWARSGLYQPSMKSKIAIREADVWPSMVWIGDCFDNAMRESFLPPWNASCSNSARSRHGSAARTRSRCIAYLGPNDERPRQTGAVRASHWAQPEPARCADEFPSPTRLLCN